MSSRNKPLAAQQPPPAFANDPGGFFGAVLAENRTAGIQSLLSGSTVFQADVAAKGRLLNAQIGWTPSLATWKGCIFTVSLSDAQFELMLEAGGDTQPGRITVIVEKLLFGGFGKGLPGYGDTFKVQAGGVWHEFVIVEMFGQHDDNEPGLTMYLEKDQNDIGD